MEITMKAKNFRSQINKLFVPHKLQIQAASNHFRQTFMQYKTSNLHKNSIQCDAPILMDHQRSPSYLSELSWEPQANQPAPKEPLNSDTNKANRYELKEWSACHDKGLKDSESIHLFYNQLFTLRKVRIHNERSSYDFKKDEKEILLGLYNQLKGKDNFVTFEAITTFFDNCRLYYLCYNIEPQQLLRVLKESAHQKSDRLSKDEFLNFFFADRPNVTGYEACKPELVRNRCVLSEQSWNQLKGIFSTLDTFGNETIYINPFIYKVKNNYSNRGLINVPAVEFPQIKRTIALKKVLFNIEFRQQMSEKAEWKDIEGLFTNYEHRNEPTIDKIYQQMVETGRITNSTNYFMLKAEIIEEIKRIYDRSPKYCDFFVKSSFICKELLDSSLIKTHLREAVVRIVEEGSKARYILLEEQIRVLSAESEEFIDLDQLLEHFSIKGLLNSGIETDCISDEGQTSEEQNQLRIRQLQKAKSQERIRDLERGHRKGYKPVRHLTVCQEFALSQKKGQTIMERKGRLMKEQKEAAEERQLGKKFKANPIPAQLNPERYRAYVKKMQEQKQMRRQQNLKQQQAENRVYQYLKTNTLLFAKKERPKVGANNHSYHHAAKPIPWHLADTAMLDKINSQKELRRKKITTDAKIKMLKEWKNLPDVAQQFSEASETHREDIFEPEIHTISKVKKVPDFVQLHKQFAESLEKKKKQWSPTKPIQFSFSCYKRRVKAQEVKPDRSALLRRVKSQDLGMKSESPQHKTSVQTYIIKEKVYIPTTLKHQQMVSFNQERRRTQLQEKQRLLRQENSRLEKQKNFAKFMWKKLKQSLHKSQSLHDLTRSKLKKHQQDWRKLQKQNEEDLCRMYFSVMNRPFLFESQAQIPVRSSKAVPPQLRKRSKKQVRGNASKHIHQSPLKGYEVEDHDSKQSFRFQAYPCLQGKEDNAYLNQSF